MPDDAPLNPIVELAQEFGEVAIDQILADGLLKDIPIIGSVTGILKTIGSTRDYLFYRKVRAFLESAKNDIPTNLEIPLGGIEQLNRAGESCLLILDRISDVSKASLVGRLFAALASNRINYRSFHRLAEAVADAYFEDLKMFMDDPLCTQVDQREHLRSLSAVGFTRPYGDNTLGNVGIIYYEPTELSHVFLRALNICCPDLTNYGMRVEHEEEPDLVKIFNAGLEGHNEMKPSEQAAP